MRIGRILFALCLAWIVMDAAVLLSGPDPSSKRSMAWQTDFSQAWAEARRLQRPMVIHFHAHWCAPCRRMERDVLHSREILQRLGTNFIGVKVDSDRHPVLVRKFRVQSLPCDVFVDPEGRILSRTTGYQNKSRYLARLGRVESRFAQSRKIQIAKDDKFAPGRTVRPKKPGLAVGQRNAKQKQPANDPSNNSVPVDNSRSPRRVELPVGLNAYSPVSLSKWRKWHKGKKQLAATYQGIVYHLASPAELREFQNDPARFAPRLLGCDPVVLWETDRAVAGSTHYGAFFDNELFLFVSAESRKRFKQNPLRFTRTRHVLRVEQIERTRLR